MALLISNAILHTVGSEAFQTRYSDVELEVDSEVCIEFVGKHVRRLLRNPSAKEATFTAESQVYAMVKSFQKGDLRFRELSRLLCERLATVVGGNDDIPPADILVAFFDNGGQSYLAIVKLNYGECFTHNLLERDGESEHQIIKNTQVLPLSASKVEEACIIPYDPMVLRILEKSHTVGGEEVCYFSQMFLECETQISKKETVEIIQEIADEITSKYYDDSIETAAIVKHALIQETEELAEDDGVILENVVQRAFPERDEVKREFLSKAKDYGLPHELMLDKPLVKREFKTQYFKADNGVEIKCPSELFQDPDSVQMTTNPDGSISITFRNLRRSEAQ